LPLDVFSTMNSAVKELIEMLKNWISKQFFKFFKFIIVL
jgi:hypothetical protein